MGAIWLKLSECKAHFQFQMPPSEQIHLETPHQFGAQPMPPMAAHSQFT
jgi:hypothetical protein